jgi:hypothetical protein
MHEQGAVGTYVPRRAGIIVVPNGQDKSSRPLISTVSVGFLDLYLWGFALLAFPRSTSI